MRDDMERRLSDRLVILKPTADSFLCISGQCVLHPDGSLDCEDQIPPKLIDEIQRAIAAGGNAGTIRLASVCEIEWEIL